MDKIDRVEALPRYAWPVFVRLTAGEIETTDTFKPKRPYYVAQGFDPARIQDPLYVLQQALGLCAARCRAVPRDPEGRPAPLSGAQGDACDDVRLW
jgi:hypothetical protein